MIAPELNTVLNTVLNTIIAYLLGSISGSLLLGRLKHVDIRQFGSGNAGGTNALRAQGFTFALGVVLIDVGKGVVAAFLPMWLPWGEAPHMAAPLWCVMAAVVGHCYPVWHGFRG
ncbi:MAG: glycerol-3-phosphate acyltransferase, partial [Xanthomonadales bacterium]|nr:glycerol-3-phosphate acyltransferase [Xanthomonadales bacterium]